MAFGKRQSGVGAAAQAVNAGATVTSSPVANEMAGGVSPLRWFIILVACSAGLYFHLVSYGPDLWRDHRLAGTWQPAYDLQVTDGKCERFNFVITTCNAKIKSVARPDQAPIPHSFMMLFSSGGGEALVPVRSTTDRSAVSIFYAAETKLWNRTLSFVVLAGMLALFDFTALLLFWRALNSFNP
ncbi:MULTISPECIES: hypothetical protein [unclassified Bradyrhizobium]|uniref:hypothetical protein n=1 Tax=unclassified Bradyrhizobium TaxID=2631580 RepID=UPI0020B34FD1|nr:MULTISPECIES: hypothetical protein [unclassified Bradyrhizobium]MCP3379309.1 hypothetical protein [Bradyrhizobium sp. CCGUVB4N]MCP3440059.1 hypothetical protein [Bradyrhizobium sp. CCGUVB14]